jgi:hypothetical protein
MPKMHKDETRAMEPWQKKDVMEKLLKLWMENPELRLGQLINNYISYRELYHIEDYDLIDSLSLAYRKSSS